jgi:hypothetical protein
MAPVLCNPRKHDGFVALVLTTGWSYGLSAGEIAVELAWLTRQRWTRNMVIGLAHRLHLPPHPGAPTRYQREPSPPRSPATIARSA